MSLDTPQRLDSLVEPASGSVVSRAILKNDRGNITLFAFAKGEGLSPHSAPFDAFVYIVEGEARITIAEKDHTVKAGESILMPANIPHAVQAEQDFKMLLVMIKGGRE